jgi:succinate dehydrogenase / fumarate reductase flavoprotein subunit
MAEAGGNRERPELAAEAGWSGESGERGERGGKHAPMAEADGNRERLELAAEASANKQKRALTRRGFLAGAAAAAAGFAAFSLSGCATQETGGKQDTDKAGPDGGAAAGYSVMQGQGNDIEIFDTELLIIGCGQGAIAAAWDALSEGQSLMIVDKAPAHHGGPTAWSWGCYSIRDNPVGANDYLNADPILRKNIYEYFTGSYPEGAVNNVIYQINKGQILASRDKQGNVDSPDVSGTGAGKYVYFEQYFKHEIDALAARYRAQMVDNTMITDLFIDGGTCHGAMGIHIPTGKFRVFRAKATIMGTGAPVWMFGWVNTKPASLGSSDNTGEVQHACYRHGIGLAEAEVPSYDFYNYYPRVAFGSVTGMDSIILQSAQDKDGKPAFGDGFLKPYNPKVYLQHTFAKLVEDGRVGPLGGIYTKCEIQGGEAWMRKDIASAQKKFFNVDVSAEYVECIPELFDKGGQPITDANMMTEVEGLFDLHAAGSGIQAGSTNTGFNSTQIKMNGAYAGHCATQFLKNKAKKPVSSEIDWQPVLDEYKRLHELRTRKVEGGIRPSFIREKIQHLTMGFFNVSRNGETIQAALEELDRIRKEELPLMYCADQYANWNREWRDAIETTAMLDLSYISAQASLLREESGRFMYRRADFPEVDPAWDGCYTLCRLAEGEYRVSKETFPEL